MSTDDRQTRESGVFRKIAHGTRTPSTLLWAFMIAKSVALIMTNLADVSSDSEWNPCQSLGFGP
ncbi:hypothetical protein [Granulicella sp. L60]|uniref:hypothetical protein n=1 Tax=Granulicella sp. L60 TaxID=1641866 RepID=UPI00131EA1C4|nr:hypothetical protein [Granulicella sp. L60]